MRPPRSVGGADRGIPGGDPGRCGSVLRGDDRGRLNKNRGKPALDRPGAWALLGRAGAETWIEPKAKERACTLDDVVAERGAAR